MKRRALPGPPNAMFIAARAVQDTMRSSGSECGLRRQTEPKPSWATRRQPSTSSAKTIRAARAAMQMREDADLGDEAAPVQRHAPDLVRPRHRYEEGALLRIAASPNGDGDAAAAR